VVRSDHGCGELVVERGANDGCVVELQLDPQAPTSEPSRRIVSSSKVRAVAKFSSEDVYHLPGTIPIDQLRDPDPGGVLTEGRELTKRFIVRGHWRRANRSWKDRRVRWVEPYWKGPDMVATIERQYRLRGPDPER